VTEEALVAFDLASFSELFTLILTLAELFTLMLDIGLCCFRLTCNMVTSS